MVREVIFETDGSNGDTHALEIDDDGRLFWGGQPTLPAASSYYSGTKGYSPR